MPQQKTVQEQSYDDVNYESYSFRQTHAQNLYTIGKLFGLNPPDLKKCRVLEIGCASGGNLIPQALQYPDAKFVGIDISGKQIEHAQNILKTIKLKNVKFIKQDIMDLDNDLGKFDYIIAHGVLSWIPPEVQKKMLAVYKELLSKNGIGFISYNTLPGWNAVRSVRDIMRFHASRFDSMADKIPQAKSLLEFLSKNLHEKDPYKAVIDREKKEFSEKNDYYIYHEHLEAENHQFYLHEFVKMLDNNDLRYVGDTNLPSMYPKNMPPESIKELQSLSGNVVMQEQYMDFLTNRRFRNSIITHKNLDIERKIDSKTIYNFYVSANFKEDLKKSTKVHTVFRRSSNFFGVKDTDIIKIYKKISNTPHKSYKLDSVVNKISKDLKASKKEVKEALGKQAMELVFKGFLELSSVEANFTSTVVRKPETSPYIRYQASLPHCDRIANVVGTNVAVNHYTKFILSQLDGEKTINAILKLTLEQIKDGQFSVKNQNEEQLTSDADLKESVKETLVSTLAHLARNGLLTTK